VAKVLTAERPPGGPPKRPQARSTRVRNSKSFFGLLLPPVLWWILVLGVPYVFFLIITFWRTEFLQMRPDFSLHNYQSVFTVPVYWQTLLRSIKIAALVTVISLAIGYPVAYYIATRIRRRPMLFFVLFQIPLWVSYLIRAYAWRVILGRNGVINGGLTRANLIDEPLSFLLFSQFATILVIVTMFVPFMIMSIYPVLTAIPASLREAAKDLGAGRFSTFWKVTLPLSLPGVFVGVTYTAAISFGDFISPTLVGGPRGLMITQLIFNEFGVAYNWPLGATLGVVMFLVILPLLVVSARFEQREVLSHA
jgi:spermidine/putrescine transport system permease protein